METCPGEGVVKEEKFPNIRKPLADGSVGSFEISEGNRTGGGNPQIMCLTATPSREIAQTLAADSSETGLNREVRVGANMR